MTEVSSREATFRYLDYIGNHERKIGLAAVVLANPDEFFSANALRRAMNECQGAQPVWPISWPTTMQYLTGGLMPGGVAVQSEMHVGDTITAVYQACEAQQALLRSLIGFGVIWSLDYPQLSLQQVLGTTRSSGQVRCPQARYKIYGYLLAQDGPSITQLSMDLNHVGYKTSKILERQVEVLRDAGIVTVRTVNDYHPALGEVTQIRLSADVATPIRDLHSGIQIIMNGRFDKAFERMARLLAQESGTELFARLIAKGKDFSGSYAGSQGRGVIESQVMSLMTGSAAFTVDTIRTALSHEHGRNISTIPLRRILNDMVKQGSLTGNKERRNPHRLTNVYSIQDPSHQQRLQAETPNSASQGGGKKGKA